MKTRMILALLALAAGAGAAMGQDDSAPPNDRIQRGQLIRESRELRRERRSLRDQAHSLRHQRWAVRDRQNALADQRRGLSNKAARPEGSSRTLHPRAPSGD